MADPCTHPSTGAVGRTVARVADADTAVEGLTCETTIGTCTACGALVAFVELRAGGRTPPLFLTCPATLHPQGGAR